MAGAGFGTDLDQMRTSGQHVFEVNDEVQTELSQLGAALDSLMAQWQGQAAVSFGNVRMRWDSEARTLNDALKSIGDTLMAGHTDYTARQQNQSDSFGRIGGTLNPS
jgi:WXG100 family type VII secretion target